MDPYASGLLVSTVQLENRVDDDDRGESTRACNYKIHQIKLQVAEAGNALVAGPNQL